MSEADLPFTALKDSRKRRACLMIVYGGDIGRKLWIVNDVSTIGRGDSDVDFGISSERMSRKHCAISVKAGKYAIKDLGSTNGTIVNNQKITGEVPLQFGDKIQCGDVVFQFVSEASIETLLVDRLKEDNFRDGLTQVYNKKILKDVEHEFFEAARKDNSNLAVILFDIDHFKKINDSSCRRRIKCCCIYLTISVASQYYGEIKIIR